MVCHDQILRVSIKFQVSTQYNNNVYLYSTFRKQQIKFTANKIKVKQKQTKKLTSGQEIIIKFVYFLWHNVMWFTLPYLLDKTYVRHIELYKKHTFSKNCQICTTFCIRHLQTLLTKTYWKLCDWYQWIWRWAYGCTFVTLLFCLKTYMSVQWHICLINILSPRAFSLCLHLIFKIWSSDRSKIFFFRQFLGLIP